MIFLIIKKLIYYNTGYINTIINKRMSQHKFMDFIYSYTEKYDKYRKTLLQDSLLDDNTYESLMLQFHKENIIEFQEKIEQIQNSKIMSFNQSGIITKKLNIDLKNKLLENINLFSNKQIPDYHPGSDNKVQDIIHPSLYPLQINLNKEFNSDIVQDYWNRPYEDSKYQWLPSEFGIDQDGKCNIESYINNLPFTLENAELYKSIQELFEYTLTEFEKVWFKAQQDNSTNISLRNRKLQVITKIVKISLIDDNLIGAWHVEGMSHENIIATASCTLEQDTELNAELFFKRTYTEGEAESLTFNTHQNPSTELVELLNKTYIPLGKVQITEDDLIVFPNSHIHKVDMKINENTKCIKSRTILVFWLINPDIRITSTKDIEQQDYDINQAYINRLELMKERTLHKQSFNQRELNLCEH